MFTASSPHQNQNRKPHPPSLDYDTNQGEDIYWLKGCYTRASSKEHRLWEQFAGADKQCQASTDEKRGKIRSRVTRTQRCRATAPRRAAVLNWTWRRRRKGSVHRRPGVAAKSSFLRACSGPCWRRRSRPAQNQTLSAAIGKLEARQEKRFAGLEARMDKQDSQQESVQTQFKDLEKRLQRLEETGSTTAGSEITPRDGS